MLPDSTLLDRIVGNTIIRILPPDRPLPMVDAIVEEQDTNLLLGKTTSIEETSTSYPMLVKKMERQKPLSPGNVIVQRTLPKCFISIIYDIEGTPICRDEWINSALNNILEKCVTFRIGTLAMPLPGVAHGKFSELKAMDMILKNLQIRRARYPRKIWIYTP